MCLYCSAATIAALAYYIYTDFKGITTVVYTDSVCGQRISQRLGT